MSTNEELAMQAKDGDRDALLMLWHQVNRFAYKQALRWQGHGAEMDDLMQGAYLALADAVGRFNPESGASLVTIYNLCLKSAFTVAIYGGRSLRLQRDPIHAAVSLDAPAGDDEDGDPLSALIPDNSFSVDGEAERDELTSAVRIALDALSPQERAVILCRFWKGLTPEKTAQTLSLADVRRIEATALRKLRHPSISKPLRRFFY